MRNRWINATLWGAAVVLAVGAGTAAVAAASGGSGRSVLSQGDVDRALAASPNPSAKPQPSGTPDPSRKPGAAQLFRVTGGTVVAHCVANAAILIRWTPDTGYRADDPILGPAAAVSIRFESDTLPDVKVTVTCPADKPVAKTSADGDDHSGGGGGGSANPSAKPTDDHGDGNGSKGGGNDDAVGHH
jgi:hypothetical protein